MFQRGGFVCNSTNPQVGVPPLAGCPALLIQYIRSCCPYCRPFLHPQREDAPCRGNTDPLITWKKSGYKIEFLGTNKWMNWINQSAASQFPNCPIYFPIYRISNNYCPFTWPKTHIIVLSQNTEFFKICILYFLFKMSGLHFKISFKLFQEKSNEPLNIILLCLSSLILFLIFIRIILLWGRNVWSHSQLIIWNTYIFIPTKL